MGEKWSFRGWDAVGSKGWVYGDLVHNKKVTLDGLEDRVMVGGYEVVPESVGFGSGILDKNGKEIFVGDIIRIYDSEDDTSFDTEVIFKYGIIGVKNHFDVPTTLAFFFHFWNGKQDDNEDNEYSVEVVGTVYKKE